MSLEWIVEVELTPAEKAAPTRSADAVIRREKGLKALG